MFFKRTAVLLSLTAFVGITTVTSSIVTLTVAPQVALAEWTFPGRGTFQFQGKSTPIASVIYTEGSGNFRVLTLNLRNGQKIRLEGDLNYSKGQPVLVIRGGGFAANTQADTIGRLNLNLVKGNLRSLRGSAAYDGQPILVNFRCS